MPHVLTRTSSVSATCCQPGFTTMFERVKIANVIKVIGMQIFSASYIVFRKDAFAMRAQSLAATSQARLLLGTCQRRLGQHLVHILLAFAGNRQGDVAAGPALHQRHGPGAEP